MPSMRVRSGARSASMRARMSVVIAEPAIRVAASTLPLPRPATSWSSESQRRSTGSASASTAASAPGSAAKPVRSAASVSPAWARPSM